MRYTITTAALILIAATNCRADMLYVSVENGLNSSVVRYDTNAPATAPTSIASGLNFPQGVAFDPTGNLFVALGDGTISRTTPAGITSTFASGQMDSALATDAAGNVYVGSNQSVNATVIRITPGGLTNTYASGLSSVTGLAFDRAGNLYATSGDSVVKITPGGQSSVLASGLVAAFGLATDSASNVFVALAGGNSVDKITPDGTVSVFASGFNVPIGLAFDSAGNLFVANANGFGNAIDEVTPEGKVSLFATTTGGGPRYLAFAPSAVPEPSSIALAILGLASAATVVGFRAKPTTPS